jgi:hypothetical protein
LDGGARRLGLSQLGALLDLQEMEEFVLLVHQQLHLIVLLSGATPTLLRVLYKGKQEEPR